MNGPAEKNFPCTEAHVTERGNERLPLGYGAMIFILVTLSVIIAAIFVYAPILPEDFRGDFIASAKAYASGFSFDGTPSGFASAIASLSSDELLWALATAVCPVIIFRKRLIYVLVAVRTFFLAIALGFVLSADVRIYPAIAVSVSSAASLSAFVYSSYAALRFGDLIHEKSADGTFYATAQFILKILSALGCYVITDILILLPSAFI